MARDLKLRLFVSLAFIAALALAVPGHASSSDDDDAPINLSPVQAGSNKPQVPTAVPTSVPTAAPTLKVTSAPTAVPAATPLPTATMVPTVLPTPRPRHIENVVRIRTMNVSQDASGVFLKVDASSMLRGRVQMLKNPSRLLVSFHDAILPQRRMAKEIGFGSAVRARLAQHPGNEVWLVVDLIQPVAYKTIMGPTGFGLKLQTGAAQTPEPTPAEVPQSRIANLPKVDLMFFDVNVLFEGKQYPRFPCANFIYDKADRFPLNRQFITTLVFHDGYGAFVGNLRIVDPQGNVIDHTKEPIAFNLFNALFDYSAEIPWDVTFPDKGFYSLILTLNGEDILEHHFYVGHSDDNPDMKTQN